MNGVVIFLLAAVLVCSTANAGPYYPFYRPPYAAVRSYFYNGATPVAPVASYAAAAPYAAVAPYAAAAPYAAVAPYAAAPYAAAAPVAAAVPTVLGDYYSYAAANALSYPGYSYGYPYVGAYTGYPYLKK